jgi:hypothetical protein
VEGKLGRLGTGVPPRQQQEKSNQSAPHGHDDVPGLPRCVPLAGNGPLPSLFLPGAPGSDLRSPG